MIRFVTKRTVLVKLRMGAGMFRRSRLWCPKPRVVQLANIRRLASRREVMVGFPIEPAVAS